MNNCDDDWGFQCSPEFPNKFEKWKQSSNFKKEEDMIGKYNFDINDIKYIYNHTRISVPKGGIILWNNKMAHGSTPNNSLRPICCMFLKMVPKNLFSVERYNRRKNKSKKIFKENKFTNITNINKILFGLE